MDEEIFCRTESNKKKPTIQRAAHQKSNSFLSLNYKIRSHFQCAYANIYFLTFFAFVRYVYFILPPLHSIPFHFPLLNSTKFPLYTLTTLSFPSTSLHSTLLHFTLLYSTLLYSTLLYSTLLYFTLLHSTLLYSILLYFTLLHFTPLYITPLYFTLLHSTLLYSTSLHHIKIKGQVSNLSILRDAIFAS